MSRTFKQSEPRMTIVELAEDIFVTGPSVATWRLLMDLSKGEALAVISVLYHDYLKSEPEKARFHNWILAAEEAQRGMRI